MEIVVGWDWADDHHDVVVQDRPGHTLWVGQVNQTRDALEALEAQLVAWAQHVRTDVHVVIETSQGLVVDWLSTTGFWVYPVNPKVSDARRKPSGAKTDRLDAAILARLGWYERDQLRPLRPTDEDWVELRQLTRIDEDLTQQMTRLSNQLTAALKSYYPQVLAAFAEINRPVALAFLAAWPDPVEARNIALSDLITWLRQHRYARAAQEAPRIWSALQQRALEASPGKRRAQMWAVRAWVAQLQALQTEQRALRKHLEKLFLANPDADLWTSVPGVGVTLGARLLAGFGPDRDRFERAEAAQALAGTSPVLYQSGKLKRVHMRRACDKHFRATVHQFAFSSLSHCPWARQYYEQYRSRGHGHHAALRALGNVWLRIVFRMWKTGQHYDESRFLADRAQHAS
ncbi:IS110 family transposase [Sulfobacillus thermosulfidooxidans]|uniref:IS110 family transposase n=1 Tax=Sulfobacillus thermosulfidooxidans TaxID=28034 RepID=UPI0006B50A83|nr:IS110 family transposase [Sulfobacillus thermosulfidooxidans]